MNTDASIDEIKSGFRVEPVQGNYACLHCDATFRKGFVYPAGDAYMDAGTAAAHHVREAHGDPFELLLHSERKYTGLTDLQAALLERFYRGESDGAIVEALGMGSASTVRNHRFALRERQKQARVFVALMDLLEERLATQKPAPKQESAGPLKLFPRGAKKRTALLEVAATAFVPGQRYQKAEADALLKEYCEDFATLRRELVDHQFLGRDPDGSAYWRIETNTNRDAIMDSKKALKQQYKQAVRPAGVFQIRNTVNGKVLVVGSMNLDGSRNRFAFEQKVGSVTKNRALQEEWKQFGAEKFVFEVLEELETDDVEDTDCRAALTALEARWLEKLQPFGERGYNPSPKE